MLAHGLCVKDEKLNRCIIKLLLKCSLKIDDVQRITHDITKLSL